nr:hypothetical protein [Candidatus Sigynarchaeum springense]
MHELGDLAGREHGELPSSLLSAMDATIRIVADKFIDTAVLSGSSAVAANIAGKTIGTTDQHVGEGENHTKGGLDNDGNSMLPFLHVFSYHDEHRRAKRTEKDIAA